MRDVKYIESWCFCIEVVPEYLKHHGPWAQWFYPV
uniref:Uncharacterized protein n=1 Tax=Anguilla anguilla TaxID=7936 RepID=A0A0E9W4D8_ANGAN